ncbi:hypothetical protein DCAR_0623297 [Daucus carota subsp. sativus]|uniref:Ubiquitin-like protease family profile domain-containing protein n=1 Tax=Daucus carota subsp. sativus TaxID=79200 RepID=A0A161ZTD7_DAUCS|nr:hypothetical protein DCAR_0623297 [Daucus carota subsp. sativus]
MERLKKEFGETLDKGKQLFPESDKMKEYEQRFEEVTTGRIEVFLWNNVVCLKHHIQSLQRGKEVLFHVVDAYTSILNEDERLKATESPYRFFCSTMVTMGNVVKGSQLVANTTDPNITYMKFKSNMDAILFKHRVDINHVDLIFSPIFFGNHFYVICYNLKKIPVEIIDNRSGDRVDTMYDGIPESLGIEQKRQLERARQIYATKIMYLGINFLKDQMTTEIKFVNQNLTELVKNILLKLA